MSHETVEMIITARDSLRAEVERLKAEVERLKEERDSAIHSMDLAIDSYGQEVTKVELLTKDRDSARAALADARANALEEAAGIAERTAGGLGPHGRCGARCVAAAIRAAAKEER